MLLRGDLLTVDVAEYDRQLPPGQNVIVVESGVPMNADALVVNGLIGTVERTVGEEDRSFGRLGVVVWQTGSIPAFAGQPVAMVLSHDVGTRTGLVNVGEPEQAILVGLGVFCGLVPLLRAAIRPARDSGIHKGAAGLGIDDEPFDSTAACQGADDQRQLTDPDAGQTDLVVVSRERRVVTGEEKVEAALQALRRRQRLGSLLIVRRGGQVGAPLRRRFHGEQAIEFLTVDGSPRRLDRLLCRERNGSEVDTRHVAIGDGDLRQRSIPHPLRLDTRGPALDLLDQIVTPGAADAGRVRLPSHQGQGVRLDVIALRVCDAGPLVESPTCDLMAFPVRDEALQGLYVTGSFVGPEGFVVAEEEPVQIGIDEGRLVCIVLVKGQQVLVQADRFEFGGIRVGCLRFPLEELGHGREDGTVRHELERVLRQGAGLLAGRVERQGFVGDEIVEGRPVAVRHAPFLQQVIPLSDRDALQLLLRGQGQREVAVDFREDTSQVPRGDLRPWRLGRLRPLHESPAIRLEVLPIPMGQDRLHQGSHGLGGLGDPGVEFDDHLLIVAPFDHALDDDLSADGPCGFGIGLVRHGFRDDLAEDGRSRLGQSRVYRILHLVPQRITRSRRGGAGREQKQDGEH